jgi:hypothetical protein
MSQSQKTPVSEVIGNTESFIHRVIDIRRRAAELSEQAARLQEEAYSAAIRDLGAEDGQMAFALACRGLGVDPSLRSGFDAPPAVIPTPISTAAIVAANTAVMAPVVAPAVALVPVATVALSPVTASLPTSVPASEQMDVRTVQTITQPPATRLVQHLAPSGQTIASTEQDDPSRLVRYGVAIKRSKLAEAQEVIDQALRTAAQNRKSNPYSDDRGRNAWRNTLFSAVLSAQPGGSDQSTSLAQEPVFPASHEVVPAPVSVVEDKIQDVEATEVTAQAEESASEHDAHVDLTVLIEEIEDTDNADVLDDAMPVLEIASPAPILPSRAVAFTNNPVQSANQLNGETRAPSPPPLSRQSSPFSRSVPSPVSAAVPEVHVDRPVQNRTFAHGQAVPMPRGLKEAISLKETIKKIDDEPPSTPTITPPPLRKAPSFIPR